MQPTRDVIHAGAAYPRKRTSSTGLSSDGSRLLAFVGSRICTGAMAWSGSHGNVHGDAGAHDVDELARNRHLHAEDWVQRGRWRP